MRLVELVSERGIVHLDASFEPVLGIDEHDLIRVPTILGVEDKELEVPAIGRYTALPRKYEGWLVAQLRKEPRADSGEGREELCF